MRQGSPPQRSTALPAPVTEQSGEHLPSDAGQWLEAPGAKEAFERLVRDKCDRSCLLNDLRACRLAWDVYLKDRPQNGVIPRFVFDDYFGFDRKSLGTVLKRMHQCAGDVETLSRKLGSGWVQKIFSTKLSPELRESERAHLDGQNVEVKWSLGFVVPSIPYALRTLAVAVAEEAEHANFRAHPMYDEALAGLLLYVRETTGHWYYEKVATLLRAAVTLGDSPHGADLRVWASSRSALHPLIRKP